MSSKNNTLKCIYITFEKERKKEKERERDVTYTTVMQQLSKLSFFRQKIFKSKYDQLAPGVVSSHLIELGEFI